MDNYGEVSQPEGAVKPLPNLVKIDELKSQGLEKYVVRGIKCKCGKSWCRVCSIKTVIKRFCEHVKDWDWQCVRELILTVDRNKFDSPEQASDFLSKNKRIAGLIRNLERTQEIVILLKFRTP
ncbi:MAG: hypothetical protein ABIJ91_03635 [Candidatus Kuenenbacteria bacterium]